MMEKINFFKYQGAGNDFIIIDDLPNDTLKTSAQELSKKICDRHYGVGADGLVIIKKQDDMFAWDFFNSDGSFAAMCGNAARCVALHIYKEQHLASAVLQTGAGLVGLKKIEDKFSVEMPPYKNFEQVEENVVYVDTGVPHFAVEVHKDEDVFSYIKEYRWHKMAGEYGANVSFYYKENDTYIAKTFERGVEGFTLACGTGAAACGVAIFKKSKQSQVPISMPGGNLTVQIVDEKLFLIGSAERICQGEFYV
ncbi:MAG: diaminopimelate epimerase [Bdellovibrionales bacterium]|nr:diaminopimelate epimerase [Bdellovibrionales bacterium]